MNINFQAETKQNSNLNANQKRKGDHDLNSPLKKKPRQNMVIVSKFKKEIFVCVMSIILLTINLYSM